MDYQKRLGQLAKARPNANVAAFREGRDQDDYLPITIFFSSPESQLRSEIQRSSRLLLTFHEEIVRSLSWSPLDSNQSLVALFKFPHEIRVPCEQYLQYFVQFLRDLGVEADSELKHEAGRVLFSVTPKDKAEALDNIRQALEIYILLASPIGDEFVVGESIAYQRLTANVLHLRSQLQLARALCQAQDATIEVQQIAIGHQRAMSGTVIQDSVVNVQPASDKEQLFGGRLTLGKYETKGVGVDWALLFRDLRQLFKDSQERLLRSFKSRR